MLKVNNLYKITILAPRAAKEVSKHRFSGSRNHFLPLDIMCDEEKTLMGAL